MSVLQARTFDRRVPHGVAGLASSPPQPQQRQQQTLQRLQQLRHSLSSVVSSRSPSAASVGGATATTAAAAPPPPRLPALGRPRAGSTSEHAFLTAAQAEVERLTRERHALIRTCVEQEGQLQLLQGAAGRSDSLAAASSVCVAAPSGEMVTPRGAAAPAPAPAANPQLAQAVGRLLHEASACFPEMVIEDCLLRAQGFTSADAVATACQALDQVAAHLPELVAAADTSTLVTEAGADLLLQIHTLQEEKERDCERVLQITQDLTAAAEALKAEGAAKDEEIRQLQEQREAQEAEVARLTSELAAYAARVIALETTLEELHAARDGLTAEAAELREGHAAEVAGLAAAIASREAAVAELQGRVEEMGRAAAEAAPLAARAVEVEAPPPPAAAAAATAATTAVEVSEEREMELQRLRAEVARLQAAAARSTSGSPDGSLMDGTLPEEEGDADGGDADGTAASAAAAAGAAGSGSANRSERRRAHERAALVKRLRRQATALEEAEELRVAAEQREAMLEVTVAQLQARLDAAHDAPPPVRETAPMEAIGGAEFEASTSNALPFELLNFAELARGDGVSDVAYLPLVPALIDWVADPLGPALEEALHGLAPDDAVEAAAGGPLYQVGCAMASHLGLVCLPGSHAGVPTDAEGAWRRLFLHLQHALTQQRAEGGAPDVVHRAADAAQFFFSVLQQLWRCLALHTGELRVSLAAGGALLLDPAGSPSRAHRCLAAVVAAARDDGEGLELSVTAPLFSSAAVDEAEEAEGLSAAQRLVSAPRWPDDTTALQRLLTAVLLSPLPRTHSMGRNIEKEEDDPSQTHLSFMMLVSIVARYSALFRPPFAGQEVYLAAYAAELGGEASLARVVDEWLLPIMYILCRCERRLYPLAERLLAVREILPESTTAGAAAAPSLPWWGVFPAAPRLRMLVERLIEGAKKDRNNEEEDEAAVAEGEVNGLRQYIVQLLGERKELSDHLEEVLEGIERKFAPRDAIG